MSWPGPRTPATTTAGAAPTPSPTTKSRVWWSSSSKGCQATASTGVTTTTQTPVFPGTGDTSGAIPSLPCPARTTLATLTLATLQVSLRVLEKVNVSQCFYYKQAPALFKEIQTGIKATYSKVPIICNYANFGNYPFSWLTASMTGSLPLMTLQGRSLGLLTPLRKIFTFNPNKYQTGLKNYSFIVSLYKTIYLMVRAINLNYVFLF